MGGAVTVIRGVTMSAHDKQDKDEWKPTSLYKIIHGHEDPAQPHRLKFLELIGVNDAAGWRDALECMIGNISQCIREEEKRHSRKLAREKLAEIDKLAKKLIKLTGDNEVVETLRTFAPASRCGIDDVTGYQYLKALRERASKARERISPTPGDRGLAADLGQPGALLLCAMMTCASWTKATGKAPGEKNPKAHDACEALWTASDGTPRVTEAGPSRWGRHIREAKGSTRHEKALGDAAVAAELWGSGDPKLKNGRDAGAFLNARLCVSDCIKLVQQKRP